MIVNTFPESYNITDKKIVPFSTSVVNSMGKTNEKLKPSWPGAMVEEGEKRNGAVKDMQHCFMLSSVLETAGANVLHNHGLKTNAKGKI